MTTEQEEIVKTIKSDDCDFLQVSAVSGSGKTFTLTKIVEALKPKKGLYIAYNKAIAEEAASKFPKTIDCRTTHSLAYKYTVRDFGLKVGFLNYRNIEENITYEQKLQVLDNIELFCLSEYTTFEEFSKEKLTDVSDRLQDIMLQTLNKMSSGDMSCTHSFYLKLFHMLLAEDELDNIPTYDILLLDEAGRLKPCYFADLLTTKSKEESYGR